MIKQNGQTFQAEVYYHVGGHNHFNGFMEGRGYYLSVVPATIREINGKEFVDEHHMKGVKDLLVEVSRKSKKREDEAIALATEEKINTLIAHIS